MGVVDDLTDMTFNNLNCKARNPTGFRRWVVHVIPYSGHKYNFLTKFHINAQIFIRNIVEVMH